MTALVYLAGLEMRFDAKVCPCYCGRIMTEHPQYLEVFKGLTEEGLEGLFKRALVNMERLPHERVH